MNITGKLKFKGEIKEFGSNGFTKRDIVIQTEEQYPQNILLELHKDNCAIVDNIAQGDAIICYINVRGREWVNPEGESKYFNSLVCWRIEAQPLATGSNSASSNNPNPEPIGNVDEDDLPF